MSKRLSSLYQSLLSDSRAEPLSDLLPRALTLSRKIGHREFEAWIRLELNGYFDTNPVLTDEIEVPKYRTVAGERSDEYGRPLVLQDPRLQFVNEDRLRHGIAELESLARQSTHITIRDLVASEIIRDTLGVDVTRFSFHPSSVDGVLSAIRAQLADWLYDVEDRIPEIADQLPLASKKRSALGSQVRMFSYLMLALALLTASIFAFSLFVQPILPPTWNSILILLVPSFLAALGILAQFKSVYEFIGKVFGDRS